MVIDVIGIIRNLLRWVLKEVLLLLGIIWFGLSAPLIFMVVPEWLVWKNYHDMSWGVAYMFLGPFACAIWIVFICHWHSVRQWQRAGKLDTWRRDHGGIYATVGKSIWFMIAGFFGSALAEGIFLVTATLMVPRMGEPTRKSAMFFWGIAPFAVFAPCWIVLLSRWIRRDEYAATF